MAISNARFDVETETVSHSKLFLRFQWGRTLEEVYCEVIMLYESIILHYRIFFHLVLGYI
jgi:hypothetical protein